MAGGHGEREKCGVHETKAMTWARPHRIWQDRDKELILIQDEQETMERLYAEEQRAQL